MIVTYEEEEIRYSEEYNEWIWEGKNYESLKLAKVAIDRAHKVEFTRSDAWVNEYSFGGPIKKVTVTSHAEYDEYWTSEIGSRQRRKIGVKSLFADSAENATKVNSVMEIDQQIKALQKQRSSIVGSLDAWVPPTTPEER